jgi:type II secretory pathway pseudopilin PulG
MKQLKSQRGITLVEVLFTAFITATLGLMLARVLPQMLNYFRTTQVRNKLQTDAANCMNTMTMIMRKGDAHSTIISTPAGNPPYSRIQFRAASDPTTTFAIYFENGEVRMEEQSAGLPAPRMSTLARSVTSLNFMEMSDDPATKWITLRLDARTIKDQIETVMLSNQVVHMVTPP